MRGHDGKACLFENRHYRAQRAIVALLQRRMQARHKRQRGGVDARQFDLGPPDPAAKADARDAAVAQVFKQAAQSLDPEGQVGVEPPGREPRQHADQGRAVLRPGHGARQVALAADQGQHRDLPPASGNGGPTRRG